jgi:hypothetical protein
MPAFDASHDQRSHPPPAKIKDQCEKCGLAGLLDLDLINGFENLVASNDVFVLASATGPILGAFGNVASGSRVVTNTNLSFDVWYGAGSIFDPNQLVVTGVPEPSRAVLAMAGLLGVLMRRRRGAVREA